MKKIEMSNIFLREHIDLFKCPICGEEFQEVKENSMICMKKHQFDLSKKGTLHLLSKSGQNEYGKEMLSSRKQLADSGFFYPLLDAVMKQVDFPHQDTILDVGCGEGSHLHYLSTQGLKGTKIGFDISKDGIQLAANHFFDDAFWCVADLAHSPFAAEKFDVILNIFSPSQYQEFERLLKPKGKIIKVVPDSDYLIELREALFKEEKSKQVYENEKVVQRFKVFYPDCSHQHVRYTIELTEKMAKWLVEMTPLAWNAPQEALNQIKKHPIQKITVAASVLVGIKK